MGQIPRSVERISSFIYFTPSSFIHYVSIPLDLINVLSCFQDFLIFTRFEGFLTFLIFVTFFTSMAYTECCLLLQVYVSVCMFVLEFRFWQFWAFVTTCRQKILYGVKLFNADFVLGGQRNRITVMTGC